MFAPIAYTTLSSMLARLRTLLSAVFRASHCFVYCLVYSALLQQLEGPPEAMLKNMNSACRQGLSRIRGV